jgi:lysophospholipase L1-like esterase
MRHILCLGDSNTWGAIPGVPSAHKETRHPAERRWTFIMAAELGAGFRVIKEGLNGRAMAQKARGILAA